MVRRQQQQQQQEGNNNSSNASSFSCDDTTTTTTTPVTTTTYSIDICKGPYCMADGAGAAVLEIEELCREHHSNHNNTVDDDGHNHPQICVVSGGCRSLCDIGPAAYVFVQKEEHLRSRIQGDGSGNKHKHKTKQTSTRLGEYFIKVKDPATCHHLVQTAIAYASSGGDDEGGDNNNNNKYGSTTVGTSTIDVNETGTTTTTMSTNNNNNNNHRSQTMLARKAERTRWDALKDVSRTIVKCKKVVTAAAADAADAATTTITTTNDNDGGAAIIERKLRIWKETCTDRLHRIQTQRPTPRDLRRTERLVKIVSDKLDFIYQDSIREDSDSDSDSDSSDSDSSSSSSSSSSNDDDDDDDDSDISDGNTIVEPTGSSEAAVKFSRLKC